MGSCSSGTCWPSAAPRPPTSTPTRSSWSGCAAGSRAVGARLRHELDVEARLGGSPLELPVALGIAGGAPDAAGAVEDEGDADARAEDGRGAAIGRRRVGAESPQDEVVVGRRAHG